ncbi:MAG: hypothetical protein LRY73_00165 [Bacillus sp. (in: Bacteria)]|nr:hypothetical protein [Bacillus sp. (in: firmicutes)]
MSNKKSQDEHGQELRQLLKQRKTVDVPKEVREKSLKAFQQGLKDGRNDQIKEQKRQKLRQQVVGGLATVTAAAVAGLLLFQSNFLTENILNWDEPVPIEETDPVDLQDIDVNEEVLDWLMDRPSTNSEDLTNMRHWRFINNELSVPLPVGWTLDEEEDNGIFTLKIAGSNTEELTLIMFPEGVERDAFDLQLEKLMSNWSYTEATIIPNRLLTGEYNYTMGPMTFYENIFAFNTDTAALYGFIDEDTGRVRELYLSTLFGMPMIYTADYPIDYPEVWNQSWLIFSKMTVNEFFTVRGREGEIHPDYQLPVKKMIMKTENGQYKEMEIDLLVLEEIGFTSYMPTGSQIDTKEHETFVEWRFTHPSVSENSFFALGKLKDSFPLEKRKEVLFEAFGIEEDNYKETGMNPNMYYYENSSYYDPYAEDDTNEDVKQIDGFFEFFEQDGTWYFIHEHVVYESINDRKPFEIETFLRYMEWH